MLECSDCGAATDESSSDERRPCPRCGSMKRRHAIGSVESVGGTNIVSFTTTHDSAGELVADSIVTEHEGGQVGSSMDYRAGTYRRVATTGESWSSPTKDEVHARVGTTLVTVGAAEKYEPVDERTERFPDIRVFAAGLRTDVEVRHVDDRAVRDLYRDHHLHRTGHFDDLRAAVLKALEAKADYDPSAMRKMWLALYLPFAPSDLVMAEIRTAIALHMKTAARAYAQIWLVSAVSAERVWQASS